MNTSIAINSKTCRYTIGAIYCIHAQRCHAEDAGNGWHPLGVDRHSPTRSDTTESTAPASILAAWLPAPPQYTGAAHRQKAKKHNVGVPQNFPARSDPG